MKPWPVFIQRGSLIGLTSVFAARVLAALGGILISLLIARVAGAEVLGNFAFALSLAAVLAMVARCGLDNCILKATAGSRTRDDWQKLPGNFHHSLYLTSGAAGVVICLAAGAVWLLPVADKTSLYLLVAAVLPLSLLAIVAGYLRGLDRVALASLLDVGGLSLAAVPLLAIYVFLAQDLSETVCFDKFSNSYCNKLRCFSKLCTA